MGLWLWVGLFMYFVDGNIQNNTKLAPLRDREQLEEQGCNIRLNKVCHLCSWYSVTVRLQSVTMSNTMMSSPTMSNERSYSLLLSLTLPPPLPLPSLVICHHLNMYLSHLSHSFTHPPPPHPNPTPHPTFLPPSPPSSLLSNYVQRYTGGSWVRRQTGSSGEWCKSCSGPLSLLFLLLLLLHPPATACLLSAMSACHVRLLFCFPCLSCLFSFLK